MQNLDFDALEVIIQKYEARIDEVRKDEVYKWETAHRFRQHWNLDADDLAGMIESAFPKSSNLIAGPNWFPVGMLKVFVYNDPAAVRSAMVGLLDEGQPLKDRMVAFSEAAEEWLKVENAKRAEHDEQPAKNHFQDTRSMCVYLAFANPEQNYLYKTEMFRKFAKAIGADVPGNKFDKVVAYRELCDEVLEYLKENHSDLIELSDSMLAPELVDVDPKHHILVQDIVYFTDAYMNDSEPNSGAKTAEATTRVWMYAPGHGASAWDECVEKGIMVLGWDEIGDYAQYPSREAIADALKEAYEDDGSRMNSSLACWQFQNEIAPGDIVYAKRGKYLIIGKGIVKSAPRFEPERESYTQVRDVEWVSEGEWNVEDAAIPMDAGGTMKNLPMKTLTEWTMYPDAVDAVERLLAGEPTEAGDRNCKYWWLNANPKYWSFDSIEPGEGVIYEAYNEKGNKRAIYRHYQEARVGDKVVGYHTYPKKEVVCLCEIVSELDESSPNLQDRGISVVKIQDVEKRVSYDEIKEDPILSNSEYVKSGHTGTIFELTEEEYLRIVELTKEAEDDIGAHSVETEPYTDENFLSDVFMEQADFEELKALLKRKQNVILQGAPGTGKTYTAKRLAWAMMGRKDASRVQQVQFHQSTSYDDFVYGYRPNEEGGFQTVPGVFTEFCRKASARPDEDFFFIIDEVNRANISKVFGELLMLIESDHRGESVVLPVSGERFNVPENVYIIGMMNTADRGLALIDYALRRRFAFFEMEPALDNERFIETAGPEMAPLVAAVRKLNEAIAEDPALGRGFRIGHSYFCPGKGGAADPASVVKYELAPLVEEYWFDDERRARDEIMKLEAAAS